MKKFLKKITAIACLASVLCISVCGCGNKKTDSENPSTDIADVSEATSVNLYPDAAKREIKENYTQDMSIIQRSLLNTGNTERMQNFMNKASEEDLVTVAYIGGSITYGYTVKPTECYAYKFKNWVMNTFGTEVNYVNAGISGTPSVLGNLRVERDVLSQNPDLVIIEFAVNDGSSDEYKNSYESLITKILSSNENTAVMLLFCITDTGHTCQSWMSEIGYHYQLPMVSVVNSMNEEVKAGNISFSDYSKDGSHPTPDGHTWIAEYLEYACTTIYNMDFESDHYELPSEPCFANYYKDMTLYTKYTLELTDSGSWKEGDSVQSFPDGWSYDKSGDNSPLTFTADFRCMTLLYHQLPLTDTSYGSVDVYVDGELVKTINACDKSGWNNPTYDITYSSVESASHVVEIKASEGSEKLAFEILGIAYTK